MDNIASVLTLVASVIASVAAICAAVSKILKKILTPVTKQIEGMDERQCRMWLVDFLNDVDSGIKKDEVQYKFAYEVYDHYVNDLHKNSYIHDKWNRTMKG